MSLCVVFITVPDATTGKTLAEALVAAQLAACVNQVPNISSIYQWQEKIEHANEEMLICKTRQSLIPQFIEFVEARHPYEVPEIIALPIISGSRNYLDWIKQVTKEIAQHD